MRVHFVRDWTEHGAPMSFWLGAMFAPQSLLSAVLQRHSRTEHVPIDELSLVYMPTKHRWPVLEPHRCVAMGSPLAMPR